MDLRVPDVSTRPPQCKHLRKRIMEAQNREPRRYGTELKQEIARYGLARRAQGASNRVIASELGLSVAVVASWLRHAERRKQAGKPAFERIPPAETLHDAGARDAPDSRDSAEHQ
jgi:transposase-like protein